MVTTRIQEDTVEVIPATERTIETYLRIGAQATLQSVYDAPDCPALLRHTLIGAVCWQRRSEITVEQALSSPHLAPQWLAALLALGTEIEWETGRRPLQEMGYRNGSHPDPWVALLVPLQVQGRTWGDASIRRTPVDEPIVSAIAVVDLTAGTVIQARLALTGVWHEHARLADAARLLVGRSLNDKRIEQVAAAVEREVRPRGDHLGNADYRRAMAAVLTRRALRSCMEGIGWQ